jgi:phospholipid-binding lipoprotein MlaA
LAIIAVKSERIMVLMFGDIKKSFRAMIVFFLLCVSVSVAWSEEAEDETWDPIEPVNRGIFWFNDTLDVYLAEPVSRGYDFVMPDVVQSSVTRFFKNLAWPSFLVDDVVGLDFEGAGLHTGRFLINSTLGVGGLFDVAAEFGLKHRQTDLGVVLGQYGVGAGPYLVVPFLGPSNLRDLFGTTVDAYADPLTLATFSDLADDDKTAVFFGGNALRLINRRTSLLEAVDSAKEGALDYYTFVRSSYHQNREGAIKGKEVGVDVLTGGSEKEEFLPE